MKSLVIISSIIAVLLSATAVQAASPSKYVDTTVVMAQGDVANFEVYSDKKTQAALAETRERLMLDISLASKNRRSADAPLASNMTAR